MSRDMTDIERGLWNRQAILDTITLSCCALDRLDWPLMARVFAPDARIDTGDWSGDFDAFRTHWAEAVNHTLADAHHLTTHNCVPSPDDPTRASAESYVMRMSREPDEQTIRMQAMRFLDELTLADGRWHIAARRVVHDWGFTADGSESLMDDGYDRGRRDTTDLSYMRPLALSEAQLAELSKREA